MHPILALLPHIEAVIVVVTLVTLTYGLVAIRGGRTGVHRACMIGSSVLSVFFLTLYLVDHAISGMRPFPGTGWLRPLFFTILITHVAAAVTLLPLLFSVMRHALSGMWQEHRRLARKTLPLWFYVTVTGLVVYLMTHHLPHS
ncbi:MAG: DUF420 domain-containing protein [Magnetococcales bacterium]|nr:DUF420 domain-containing protein [Magnetococcales bacterium]